MARVSRCIGIQGVSRVLEAGRAGLSSSQQEHTTKGLIDTSIYTSKIPSISNELVCIVEMANGHAIGGNLFFYLCIQT